MVTKRATALRPPSPTAASAMPPLAQVAITGCPVADTRDRKEGASPSLASAWSTRGPPSALPKPEERIAPHIPG